MKGIILASLDTLAEINEYLDELHIWIEHIKVQHDL